MCMRRRVARGRGTLRPKHQSLASVDTAIREVKAKVPLGFGGGGGGGDGLQ